MATKDKKSEVLTDEKKDQLLNDALKAIEKEYGKGSIMKLGEQEANMQVDRNPVVKQHLLYMQLRNVKSRVADVHLLMLKMPLIQYMQNIWVLILMN